MERSTRAHHIRLQRKARIIHSRATSDPVARRTAIEQMRNRGRTRRVTDPHFAHNQQISLG